jgi:beta-glucosidase/6-phospho-beta-glucosidase/beta-galactosidase
MFATGIDSSCPVIDGRRVDQFSLGGYEKHWREDIELVRDLGVHYLRYGPPLHRTFVAPGRFDWEVADRTLDLLRKYDLVPIADLCRFGVPDWLGDFQNPDFPGQFAVYARAFAERFPWVQLYTPVSEIYVCALLSGRLGRWNEALKTDRAFVSALKHLACANLLAMREILEVRPDALFIQSERTGYFHADSRRAIGPAEIMNAMRYLALDLSYGHRVDSGMYEFLLDNGLAREEYAFFMQSRLSRHCVLGSDYYEENERRISRAGAGRPAGEIFGYEVIVRQYHARYGLPVMLSETSLPQGERGDEAVEWLWKQWENAIGLRNSGVPLIGFTWYPLVDQIIQTDTGLQAHDDVRPVGLFDLDRRARPVGVAYRSLIEQWQQVLPAQSVCLIVPVALPSEYHEPMAERRREWIHRFYRERNVGAPPNPFARRAPKGQRTPV